MTILSKQIKPKFGDTGDELTFTEARDVTIIYFLGTIIVREFITHDFYA